MADPGLTTGADLLELLRELLQRRSITPEDAGCQALIASRLSGAGFNVEHLRFGNTDNLFASHGRGQPHLLLLGHTDVVPPGPESAWSSPPFVATERDGMLVARGAADMKSSVAAFVIALEQFVLRHLNHPGRISLLLTSDEEGMAHDGVRRVVPVLRERGLLPDHVLVGEPSSSNRLGDVIRIGRRGSIQARLKVLGEQGHTAYGRPRENPVHRLAPLLAALTAMEFADGDEEFPATTLQVSNLRAGTGADNVTPGEVEVWFNLRHNPNSAAEVLEARVRDLIAEHDPGESHLEWRISGSPFGPARGKLRQAVVEAIHGRLAIETDADTGGGTSDGRFFGPMGIETIELGPVNRSIHRIDECIDLDDLNALPGLYLEIIERLLQTRNP